MRRYPIGMFVVLAIAVVAVAAAELPATEGSSASRGQYSEEAAEQEADEVVISFSCPPAPADRRAAMEQESPDTAARASVDPLHKVIWFDEGERRPVTWRYELAGAGEAAPVRLLLPPDFPWDLTRDPAGDGSVIYHGEPNDNYGEGVWKYAIVLECNGNRLIWDPRMETDRR